MAKFDKIAVLNKIGSTGMVPVFYHKDAEVAKKVVKACYDGGVRAFEFTNRGGLKVQLANFVILRRLDKEAVGLALIAQAFCLMVSAAQLHKVVLNKF